MNKREARTIDVIKYYIGIDNQEKALELLDNLSKKVVDRKDVKCFVEELMIGIHNLNIDVNLTEKNIFNLMEEKKKKLFEED